MGAIADERQTGHVLNENGLPAPILMNLLPARLRQASPPIVGSGFFVGNFLETTLRF
ncbi:hypothetical protein J7E73_13095 [Paenibacillus albidus]|nr:hypothetical protein [Paenibacillus albidus]